MNRQIKFRGYVKDISKFGDDVVPHKGHFVFGNLIHGKAFSYIVGEMVEANDEYATLEYWQPVDNENIDEFTGLKDQNGKDIYENDILKVDSKAIAYVDMLCGFWMIEYSDTARESLFYGEDEINEDVEVIGNIHENPELLEEDK